MTFHSPETGHPRSEAQRSRRCLRWTEGAFSSFLPRRPGGMIHHKGSLSKRARRDDDVTSPATADIAKRGIVDSIGLTVFLRREIDFADRGAEQSLWVDNTLGVTGVQNANFNNGLSRSPVARWVSLQVFKQAPCIPKSIRRPSVHCGKRPRVRSCRGSRWSEKVRW